MPRSVPVIVASLWGSLPQLHTGPVAMLSLMSAAAVLPLAALGSEAFITLSVMLALMVGVLRLLLGPAAHGHPGELSVQPGDHRLHQRGGADHRPVAAEQDPERAVSAHRQLRADLWTVFEQLPQTHMPTLLFAIATYAIIVGAKRWCRRCRACCWRWC
jgi:SulP family sulfate permease